MTKCSQEHARKPHKKLLTDNKKHVDMDTMKQEHTGTHANTNKKLLTDNKEHVPKAEAGGR
jgi:hypothetical protein